MSEPESSRPMDGEPSPDATVRLSIAKTTDPAPAPDATVRLFTGKPTEPAPAPEPTVQLLAGKPVDPAFSPDATVRLATGRPTDPVFAPGATVRLSGGRLLDTTPPPEPTVRLGAGAPGDPRSTQQLDISNILSQQQDAGSAPLPSQPEPASSSEDTHKMPRPKLDDPPIRVQKVDQPAEAAGQTLRLPAPSEALRKSGWKWPLALGVGVVIVAAVILVFFRGNASQSAAAPAPVAPAITAEPVPAGAQAYFEQAKQGDANAMRMLGVMYYYGLNVPQDREKGLFWYRKAAEKGSEAARSELSKIEGGR